MYPVPEEFMNIYVQNMSSKLVMAVNCAAFSEIMMRSIIMAARDSFWWSSSSKNWYRPRLVSAACALSEYLNKSNLSWEKKERESCVIYKSNYIYIRLGSVASSLAFHERTINECFRWEELLFRDLINALTFYLFIKGQCALINIQNK